ncbi:MAG: DUF4835 family protein [Bacteroidetes bacterium]|nr:DUF4835 family protein [Bacteroidota bacterium]MBL0018851.1 DUF4835 family protein [Bacteroidota bacterium]MBP6639891.1 DUF4835 family protein [Bacteroidia bacterium]MBP8073686.1 DUF4835 family protein [Bacteroidia bacterium]
MKLRWFIAIAGFLMLSCLQRLQAQELQCIVKVSAPTVGSDQSIYPQMEDAIMKYVNFRKWTDLNYEPRERIKCRLQIIINNRPEVDQFTGTFQVQVIRPVFNSEYESMILNVQDADINFKFVPFTPLEFSENNYIDELTSLLNFYCYMIIGFDQESFEMGGGAVHFQKAQTIVNLAGNSGGSGWRNYDGTRNRYWLVNDMLDNSMRQIHNIFYVYHRQGLDQMEKNLVAGRTAVLGALRELQKMNQRFPGKYITRVFYTAKGPEIIQIFSKANMQEKAEVIRIMSEVDPSNASDYEKINEEK